MTSRERVRAALALRQPDKVPWGEFAIDYDTVQRIIGHETYVRAKAKCQLAFWEGRREEVAQSWKEDAVDLFRRLELLDIVNLDAMAFGQLPPRGYQPDPPRKIADGTWEDRNGVVYQYSPITADITAVFDPGNMARQLPDPRSIAEEKVAPPDPSVFEVIDHLIAVLGPDHYVIGPCGTSIELVRVGDMERSYIEIADNPEGMEAVAAALVPRGNAEDAFYVRPGQDATMWGQDFSSSAGPMISPEAFRRLVVPSSRERVRNLKERWNLPVLKHACGNNWPLLDMFVEIGFACYQSIQASAGMDLGRLKEGYGRKICLWGGVSVETLVSGTPAEVRAETRRALEVGTEGGFILGSSHSIAVGTRYDNFMAMVDELARARSR